jgi:hypothetical protein
MWQVARRAEDGTMPTGLNVALQFLALVVAVVIRLSQPGWMVLAVILFVFPLVVAVLPVALALGTARRGSLSRTVAAPFVASAVTLLALALLYPELDDQTWWVPALQAVAAPSPDYDTASMIGNVALFGYVAALVWTVSAIITTRQPRVTPAEPRPSSGSA